MSSKSSPKRLSDMWIWSPSDGSTAIMSDARVSLSKFTLEGIGSLIWGLCDGINTVEDIAKKIADVCDASPSHDIIISDTVRLLRSLRDDRLIAWDGDFSVDVLLIVPPAPSVYSNDAVTTPEYSAWACAILVRSSKSLATELPSLIYTKEQAGQKMLWKNAVEDTQRWSA